MPSHVTKLTSAEAEILSGNGLLKATDKTPLEELHATCNMQACNACLKAARGSCTHAKIQQPLLHLAVDVQLFGLHGKLQCCLCSCIVPSLSEGGKFTQLFIYIHLHCQPTYLSHTAHLHDLCYLLARSLKSSQTRCPQNSQAMPPITSERLPRDETGYGVWKDKQTSCCLLT